MSNDFESVTQRLKAALELRTDTELAARLGYIQSTWAVKKMRGSIPRKQIDEVLKEQGLNPEYIYNGTGNIYLPEDGESWESLYTKRAIAMKVNAGHLIRMGHTQDTIDSLVEPKGKTLKVLHALRDFRQVTQTDLNWLIAAAPIQPVLLAAEEESTYKVTKSKDEQELLSAFRRASKAEKEILKRVAGIGGKP